jgi:hypothetical protein
LACYERQLAISLEIGDRGGECAVLGNLGNVHAKMGNSQQAIAYYEQSLIVARVIGERAGEAAISWKLGEEMVKQGDLGEQ